ncbi:MAG TPA: DNA mismatch endonuclease Vsr [Pyrinomonadaceae bacterium]|nr:DNA mismatch endonuclease Vsr [Pyrinomonadaceae bacterium]
MDKLTPERRSENMRRIRSKDMKPEIAVRQLVHRLGYRYRLHDKTLPGKPDLVFRSRHKVILVHGCFWHQHRIRGCKITREPKSNTDYWAVKLQRNVARDLEHKKALARKGWKVLTVWECEIANEPAILKRLTRFLD